MSSSFSASFKLLSLGGLLNKASAIMFFTLGTCRTSKSNNRIHASHYVTRALGRLVTDRFSYAIRVMVSVLTTKVTLYNQVLNFFNAFSSTRHSLFPTLYQDSAFNHSPLLYLVRCLRFKSLLSYIKTTPHPYELALKARIIKLAPLLQLILTKVGAVVKASFNSFIATYLSLPYFHLAPFFKRRQKIATRNIKPLI